MWVVELQNDGLENLKLAERAKPEPKAGEVLVRMRAASMNYRDLVLAQGSYATGHTFPLIPLSDGAGVVEAIGDGVTRFQVGDRVLTQMRPFWVSGTPTKAQLGASIGGPRDGVLAEYITAGAEHLVHMPSHLTDEQGATLPIAGVTAWRALSQGNLRPGDWVVVQGTGGVSIFALQFAHRLGARVIVTSSSDAKLERARQLGATHLINYKTTPNWDEAVIELTGGEGAHHVLDVGGTDTLSRSLDAIRPGGHVYLIGFLGGMTVDFELRKAIRRTAVMHGLSVGPRETFEEMNAAIEAWKLEPVVDRVFARDEFRAAYDAIASGTHFGKIAIKF